MDCKDMEGLISRYLDGEILLREQAKLDAHLQECGSCRARMEEWRANDGVLKDVLGGLAPSAAAEEKLNAQRDRWGDRNAGSSFEAPWQGASRSAPDGPPRAETRRLPRRAMQNVSEALAQDLGRLWRSRAPRWVAAAAALLLVLYVPLRASMLTASAADTRDLIVVAPGEFFSGSNAAVRVVVRDGRSQQPVARTHVALDLLDTRSGREIPLGIYRTNDDGALDVRVPVPEIDEGAYTLRVRASGGRGDQVLQAVRVARTHKILVSTDKPIYQPNQTIHVRLMALRSHDLKPEADRDLLFEIEDSRGNKIFKKTLRTSEFGISAADFLLADEINMGDYRLRATLGEVVSERVVEVKRYVLPKFKVALTPGKSFYLPGEKLSGRVQADYFFGKPVAGARVKVKLDTFETQFRTFAELSGETDESGAFSFEQTLPEYFAGVDLEKGNALLKVEISVKDTADHMEKASRMLPVANQAVRVEILHESGKPVPNLENVFWVVTTYPDGSPAKTRVTLRPRFASWGATQVASTAGAKATDPIEVATSDLGIARVRAIPERFDVELAASAVDERGHRGDLVYRAFDQARSAGQFILRTDKAVYASGDTISLEVAGKPGLYYVDLVRGGETVLTRTLEATGSVGRLAIDLPGDIFGGAELHAYRIEADGRMVRDARRILVQVPEGLRIQARLDKESYKPGETATLDFTVTDDREAPIPAAIGLAIVDEAVFALHDNQPGLEKVYFALEKELQEPQYTIQSSPVDLRGAVLGGTPDEATQEGVRVALASLPVTTPERQVLRTWPEKERLLDQELAWRKHRVSQYESGAGRIALGLAIFLVAFGVPGYVIHHRHGADWTLTFATGSFLLGLGALSAGEGGLKAFAACYAMFLALWTFGESIGSWSSVGKMITNALAILGLLGIVAIIGVTVYGQKVARLFRSATTSLDEGAPRTTAGWDQRVNTQFTLSNMESGGGGGFALGDMGGGGAQVPIKDLPAAEAHRPETKGPASVTGAGLAPAGARKDVLQSIRVRQFFPETMYWMPQLITDDRGRARLTVPLADSITTWRMTMQGVSRDGRMGGGTRGLTVFQDFFVDIDFPVALTQGDEVGVPIAVYNYLKTDQDVELVVEKSDWFDLLEDERKVVSLAAGEVKGASFRLKVSRLGPRSLTIYAVGSKGFHDAIKRTVNVVPNGKMFETSASRRLASGVETVDIPENAIDEASGLFLKLYPGAMAQVVDGLESLVRLPYG